MYLHSTTRLFLDSNHVNIKVVIEDLNGVNNHLREEFFVAGNELRVHGCSGALLQILSHFTAKYKST